MIYTDEQMITATQLAYYNLDSDYVDNYRRTHNGDYPTVQTMLQECGMSISTFIMRKFFEDGAFADNEEVVSLINELKDKGQYKIDEDNFFDAQYFNKLYDILKNACQKKMCDNDTTDDVKYQLLLERIESTYERYYEILNGCEYSNWKVISVRDYNSGYSTDETGTVTGFYGCVLETSDNNAIVAFRGSESLDKSGEATDDQFLADWINSDFAMLNNVMMPQQANARDYLNDVGEQFSDYNFAVTGHSLGGNLATYAVIECDEEVFDRVDQIINFDGPGFSSEYLESSADKIEERSSIVTHYQWSLIGALLHQLKYENYMTIKTKDSVYSTKDIEDILLRCLLGQMTSIPPILTSKHDVCFVEIQYVTKYTWTFERDDSFEETFKSKKGEKVAISVHNLTTEQKQYIYNAVGNADTSVIDNANADDVVVITPQNEIKLETKTEGQVVQGEQDVFAEIVGEMSRNVDGNTEITLADWQQWGYELLEDFYGFTQGDPVDIVQCLERFASWSRFQKTLMDKFLEDPIGFVVNVKLTFDSVRIGLLTMLFNKRFAIRDYISEAIVGVICSGWDAVKEYYKEKWAGLFVAAQKAVVWIDPLVLDINDDGFDIAAKAQGAYFDLNCDGFAEKINWTSKDAILSLDVDGNGKIDNGREVFGDYHLLADGTSAKNGFEALAQYDSNGDGIVDEQDEIFGKLRLWVDADGDGISASGELKTLKAMGIKAINLNYQLANQTTATEAIIGNVATFVYEDNTESSIGEMWVASDLYDTIDKLALDVTEAVDGLPNVRSYGQINSLHNAIMKDETGALEAMVREFVAETDNDARIAITEQIVAFLCETDSVVEGSRGNNISAKKMAVIERFMGEGFVGDGGSNPNFEAAEILEQVYEQIVEMYCFSMIGSGISKYMDGIVMVTSEDGERVLSAKVLNTYLETCLKLGLTTEQELADICSYLTYFGSNVQEDYQLFKEMRLHFSERMPEYIPVIDNSIFGGIKGDKEDNNLSGTSYIDIIYGNTGNDTINAGEGNDILLGGEGNDTLYGDDGNDFLDGGVGEDTLKGGWGSDTYIWGKGHGNDKIINENSAAADVDVLKFTNLNREDVKYYISGSTLIVEAVESGERLQIVNCFYAEHCHLEKFIFADGTELTFSQLKEETLIKEGSEEADKLNTEYTLKVATYAKGGDDTFTGSYGADIVYGGTGNDTLNGGNGNDELYGEEGNDTLYGNDENDILDGGVGEDTLKGGWGNDTYIWGKGYGNDKIINEYSAAADVDVLKFTNLNREDVKYYISGYTLIIEAVESGERLQIVNCFDDYDCSLEKFIFADGTELTYEELVTNEGVIKEGTDEANTLSYDITIKATTYAKGGNDKVTGGYGVDIIYGGTGDDVLSGGSGSDELYGEDGNDKLYGGYGADVIDGGIGKDYLDAGPGSDTYVWGIGYGNDEINNYSSVGGDLDVVKLVGINPKEVGFYNDGCSLIVKAIGSEERLIITGYFSTERFGENYRVDGFEFDDGTWLSYSEVATKVVKLSKLAENEEKLAKNNTYSFTEYKGLESISDMEGEDTVDLGVNMLNVIFEKNGDDLTVYTDSAQNGVNIEDWYLGEEYQIEEFVTADGYSITNKQVQLLIDNMASFSAENNVSWGEAIVSNNEEATAMVSQFWCE